MEESIESRVDILCQAILKTDSENWDAKNKAVLQLIDIVKGFENQSASVITETFSPVLFRTLKEPVKVLVRATK